MNKKGRSVLRTLVIAGGYRSRGQTSKVGEFIHRSISGASISEAILWNLAESPLASWKEPWPEGDPGRVAWSSLLKQMSVADCVIIVTPELHGMASPAIKDLFLHVGDQLAHKPGLIVTISESFGGSYPVSELRMSSYKNSRICYIPEHVIVRQVCHVLNGDQLASEEDRLIRVRLAYTIDLLHVYAKFLRLMRLECPTVPCECIHGM